MINIAVIGGNQEQTFKKIGKKMGCNILFHSGKIRNGATRKEFLPVIKKADCVVVLLGACGHVTMDIVKGICKEKGIKIVFQQGFGASGGIQLAMDSLHEAA